MKVAINTAGHGLYLTKEGMKKFLEDKRCENFLDDNFISYTVKELRSEHRYGFNLPNSINRSNPVIIEYMERYPYMSNISNLKILEIPDDVEYHIAFREQGPIFWEAVVENHRTWS